MSPASTHIVGAGIAGMSAGLAASGQGRSIVLYEAAPQAGGRCRTLSEANGFAPDNGTHVLFTANRRTLSLLGGIGARSDWMEPEPEGLPIFDGPSGRVARVGLSPWSWARKKRRPEGLTLAEMARLFRLLMPLADRPVGAIMGRSAIATTLIEPLTVAVLNTPISEASSRRLGTALRRLARPGAAKLLVARRGLSADLVNPALATLRARDAVFRSGERLRAIIRDENRVTGLAFADVTVLVGPEDRVVLALPPWEIARLLPGLPVPDAFEPILNLHFPFRGPARPRFVGLLGSLAQWMVVRGDHVSVTVSAAGRAVEEDSRVLLPRVWREIVPALRALGLDADDHIAEGGRLVKEKRATIRQAAGPLRQPPIRPLPNLALAGDWIGAMPATIESAVVSGERAVRALAGAYRAVRPAPNRITVGVAGGTR